MAYRVVITDLNGTDHEVTPTSCQVELKLDGADYFKFRLIDNDGSIRSWLEVGCKVKIFIDASSTPSILRLYGIVEKVEIKPLSPDISEIIVEGREWFYTAILHRLVTETYNNMEISEIIRDLLSKYLPHSEDLVLGLSFYEGEGSTIHDESQYGNNGTVYGATWVNGKYGKALQFDGQNDYAEIPHSDSLNITNEITISVWVKLLSDPDTTTDNDYRFIISKPAIEVFSIILEQDRNICVSVYVNGQRYGYWTGYHLPLNEWHHLAFTYNSETGEIRFYVDGEFFGSKQFTPGKIDTNSSNLFISWPNATPPRCFPGIIDEVLIFKRALSDEEIKQLYIHGCLHHIEKTGITLEDIRFIYRPFKECLDDLAGLCGFIYYSTPTLAFHWAQKGVKDSGLSYNSMQIKVAPRAIKSLLPIRNRVIVMGGNADILDQKQETASAYVKLSDYWYAQSFTPTKPDLSKISLYLQKIGNPPDNLSGEIREDNDGEPGDVIATFTIDKDFIETSPSWRPVTINAEVLPNMKYWIVLKKVGDTNNTYAWYHDNGSAGEHAESINGEIWTVQSGSFQFAFKTYYSVPVLASASDFQSQNKYGIREIVIKDESIVNQETARKIAEAKLAELSRERTELNEISVLEPEQLPEPGELITINLPELGIENTQYEVREIVLDFERKELHKAKFKLGQEAGQLTNWLKNLKSDLERVKTKPFEHGLLDLYRTISESFTLSDSISTYEQDSGTFTVGDARVGFADCG
ncbi:LamG domain-containing protein [bacterium]|nr:LamG domain-containing protein [bacterium]